LDFGADAFDNSDRWLRIEVRCPAGSGSFTTLSPRQLIERTPYSIQTRGLFVDDFGSVGIGTTMPGISVPGSKLDVFGGPMLVANSGDQADLLWLASDRSWVFRQEGTGAGTALKLQSIGGGGNKNFVIQTDGGVGIGTNAPLAKLDVRGDVRLGPSGEYFTVKSPANDRSLRGQINFNGTIDAERSSGGFTVTHDSPGVYSINFTTPFASAPTVVVSAQAICCRARVTQTSSTSAFVHVVSYTGNVLTDSPFHFIAMGP
jgi:hypothetical protein